MAASGSCAPKINSSSTEETNANTNTSGTITITTSTTATISITNANSNRNEAPDFPGVVNLISFFSTERRLFIRLSKPLNQDAEKCKVIMALWLWLDAIGHRGFIRQAHASSDSVLTQFVREATLCMECLLGQQVLTRLDTIEVPLTAWLLEEPINLRFFVYHRDVIMRGILYILDNVCRVVFDDKVLLSVAEDSLNSYHQLVMASGFVKYHPSGRGRRDAAAPEASEGKGKGKEIDVGTQPPPPATAQGKPPVLSVNADSEPVLAPSFRASPPSQPMEQRAAFISFTSGQHVPQDEIAQFFNARHASEGPCVEMVLIERELPDQPPMFGTVVFSSSSMMEIALCGQRSGKFYINGRFVWVRVCKPPPRRPLLDGVRQGEAAAAARAFNASG